MSTEPTTIAAYMYAVADALDESGFNGLAIVGEALDRNLPSYEPSERISARTVSKVFAAAVTASGNPFIGLKVGQYIRQKALHALGNALMASSTLREFSERLSRHFRLVSRAAIVEIEEDDEAAIIRFVIASDEVCLETQEAMVTSLVCMIRNVYTGHFNPTLVELRRPDPGAQAAAFETVFKCPVRFDRPQPAIHIDKAHFDVELPASSREIAYQNDKIVLTYLAKLDKDDIVTRTRLVIIDRLSAGNISKQLIASRLNMSPRTLQYKLSQKGTSFKDVVDDTRRALALRYLESDSRSVTEVTYLLGFSDTSNFTRAFKRWTNQSPSDYRLSRGG
jgi:AraC-like DNA-binding protein